MTEFSSTVLQTLYSLASKFILIINDESTIDFSQWSKKSTTVFTTAQFASSIENLPKHFKMFILDKGNNNIEQQRFATIDDLICRLADEIVQQYRLEANEYTKVGELIKAKEQEEQANLIYRKLRQIHAQLLTNKSPMKASDSISPILIWLISNTENNEEDTNYIEKNFEKYFSSFRIFFHESDFHDYIAQENITDMFLIIYSDYQESIAQGSHQFSNVKYIYRYGESKVQDDKIITNRDDLCYQLTYDLIDYYGKLGEQYRTNNQTKKARDMFLKAQSLCQFLSTTCFPSK
jgi:hypothetical protein